MATGRLKFSADMADAAGSQVHFVCVGTPQKRGVRRDLRFVQDAVESLLGVLEPGDLVVGKSTVPWGRRRLAVLVEEKVPGALLAWNPEFLREGFAVEDTLNPDRWCTGCPRARTATARALLDEVYASIVARAHRRWRATTRRRRW